MKTKLLKKVRRKYRIKTNELGQYIIQTRSIFGWWCSLSEWYEAIVEYRYKYSNSHEFLRCVFHYRYKRYTRKYKVHQQKQNSWSVVWYKPE